VRDAPRQPQHVERVVGELAPADLEVQMAGLDLTDARAREPDLAADGLERLRLAAGETEAPAQHLTLVLREVVEDRPPTDAEGKWIRFRSGACYKRQGAREIVRLLAAAIVSAVVLASGHPAAWAQASATLGTAGLYLIPSFKVSESFDDNILASSSNRESDFISRFYPGLQGGYSSDPFTLLLSGGFEADVFAKHPELNDPTTGWNAGLNLRYLPIRRLILGANIAYTETKSLPALTQTVADLTLANPLNPANTVQQGRQKTTLLSASSSAMYQFTPLTSGTSSISYTESTLQGGASNTAYGAQVGVSHQFTLRDTGTLGDIQNVFESPGSPTTYTNAPTVGWTRQLTPLTTLGFQAGPQFPSRGGVGAFANASLSYEYKVADQLVRASVAYVHSQGFVIGQAGPTTADTFSSSIAFAPFRSLQVSVGTTTSKFSAGTSSSSTSTSSSTSSTTTHGVTAGVSYRISRWLTARTSYSFSYQERSAGGNIPHNVVLLDLDISYPFRVDR